MEAGNVSDIKFKIMVIRMLLNKEIANMKKDTETIKKKQ